MNQTSIQLYQPTDIEGEYIALPYLPQEMIDLIFKIKTILEDADKKALFKHRINLNYVHEYILSNYDENILSAIKENKIVKTGFMILEDSDQDYLEGKYIPGTYNNYLKIKELPYFKRAFKCWGSNFRPYYEYYIDGAYCYCFADPWREE